VRTPTTTDGPTATSIVGIPIKINAKYKDLSKGIQKITELNKLHSVEESLIANPSYFDLWFAQPLNGQYKRLEFFLNLLRIVKPTVLIETGTYLGSSTILFSQFVNKIYTIESEPKYFQLSQKRFLNLSITNIEAILGKSELTLKLILKKISPDSNPILVTYLDAHWDKQIPITQELSQLIEWGGPFIALIDDFKVEDDPGYNFDEYDSVTVGLNLIPQSLFLFYPNIQSNLEGGARRGLGIVLNDAARKMIDPSFFETCRNYEI
jgi:predicted O-methyltransferase YrrM